MTNLTKTQKLNLIKCSKSDFEARLYELRRFHTPLSTEERYDRNKREDELSQAIRFCNYLQMALKHKPDFGPENYMMLDYIGLAELCEEQLF